MDVILRQDVENLGFEYEVVSVKPGYARNFLIPRKYAVIATPKAKEELTTTLVARKAEEDALISEANKRSAKLDGLEIKIDAKVGSGDKLFGSVNNADLADKLIKAGVDIEKKHIKIPGNTIKRLGKYVAKIRFHRDIEVDFEFEVIPDAASIAKAAAASKTRAEIAKLDATKSAAAKAEEESTFNYDNPLAVKPKEIIVVEDEESVIVETPAEEAKKEEE